jgi:hypothetical protein
MSARSGWPCDHWHAVRVGVDPDLGDAVRQHHTYALNNGTPVYLRSSTAGRAVGLGARRRRDRCYVAAVLDGVSGEFANRMYWMSGMACFQSVEARDLVLEENGGAQILS